MFLQLPILLEATEKYCCRKVGKEKAFNCVMIHRLKLVDGLKHGCQFYHACINWFKSFDISKENIVLEYRITNYLCCCFMGHRFLLQLLGFVSRVLN